MSKHSSTIITLNVAADRKVIVRYHCLLDLIKTDISEAISKTGFWSNVQAKMCSELWIYYSLQPPIQA
jgi:hypothetical protein